MKPIILVGDRTSHGGTVLEGADSTFVNGKQVARVGDKVSCPKDGHSPAVIISGDETTIVDGKPIARHGDKCSCGATLIASVSDTGIV
ncbi:PAAR domain-containing protein [Halomonas binhaiensis]|uniref:PAAR domain-containing protein n=1 Tax=Halomonas binhaiensis TaxID=2562282 RepID=A0A856QVX4_9GAMM|nr:PAAR domain-containing protein [Halomonas binhaiensis]QEM84052.2 PAAR domain-containing protein [Halomonas binhaiensis]